MSELFTSENYAADLTARAAENNVASFDDFAPGFFRGTGTGAFSGVMRGGAKAADFLATVGRAFSPPAATDEEEALRAHRNEAADQLQQDLRQSAIDHWTPRPSEVGRAGQVLGGLGEVVLPLVAGGGDPALLVGSQTLGAGKDLIDQGVDAKTAGGVAAAEGLATYGGLKVPIVGKTLLSRMASGAAGNTLVGSASRAAEKSILESRGYDGRAFEQSGETLTTDFLTGLLFGGVHHALSPAINPNLKPSQVDAALTLRNANHFADATAPGAPRGTVSQAGHQSALEAAINQFSRGDTVDVGEAVAKHDGAQFADDGRATRLAQEIAPTPESLIRNPLTFDAPPETKLQEIKALTAENTPVVENIVRDLNEALPGSESKLNIKADENILSKAVRPSILARKPWFGVEHIRDALRFKTVIDRIDQLPKIIDVLKSHGVGVEKIDTGKLLEPGEWGWRIVALDLRMPNGQLVEHYMPLKELEAAKKSEGHKLFEKWRNKDLTKLSAHELKEFAADRQKSRDLYQTAWETAAARTGLDDTAALASLKNFEASASSLTAMRSLKSSAKSGTSVRQVPPIRTAETSGESTTTLSGSSLNVKTSDIGTSSESIANPGAPDSRVDISRPSQVSDLSLDDALAAKPGEAEALTPEIAALAQLVEESPDAQVDVGFDENGEPRRMTAAEAFDDIRSEYEQAANDTKAYDAAVSCFLGHG
jgi:hypothetical protein